MARKGAQGVPRLRALPKPRAEKPAEGEGETIELVVNMLLVLDGQLITRAPITIRMAREVGPGEVRQADIPLDGRKVWAALEPHMGPATKEAAKPRLWVPGMGGPHKV